MTRHFFTDLDSLAVSFECDGLDLSGRCARFGDFCRLLFFVLTCFLSFIFWESLAFYTTSSQAFSHYAGKEIDARLLLSGH